MSEMLSLTGLLVSLVIMLRYSGGVGPARFPLLFAAVHLLYSFPKLLSLSYAHSNDAEYFRQSGAATLSAYMGLSCFVVGLLTYRWLAPKDSNLVVFHIDPRGEVLTYRLSIMVGAVALTCLFLLATRNGGIWQYYFQAAFYQMQLEGSNVWLLFGSRFIYPAIASMTLITLWRPTPLRIMTLALLSTPALLNILVLFRRSDFMMMGFIGLYGAVVIRGIRPSRYSVVSACVVGGLCIMLFPYFRQEQISNATGWDYGNANSTLGERLSQSFEFKSDDEIYRAVSTVDQTLHRGGYGYGTFLWDSLVEQYVPSALVGPDFKGSLMLGGEDANAREAVQFDSESYFYIAPMGFAEAFKELDVFGSFVFALLAAIVALAERRTNSLANRIFLMTAVPTVCLAATNDIQSVPARLLTLCLLSRFLGGAWLRSDRARPLPALLVPEDNRHA